MKEKDENNTLEERNESDNWEIECDNMRIYVIINRLIRKYTFTEGTYLFYLTSRSFTKIELFVRLNELTDQVHYSEYKWHIA